MQLSITTDYGIRIVLYLMQKKKIVRSGKLSEELDIPKTYILKVTKKLESAGLVKSYQGVNGGVCILKTIDEITLWDVICAIENTTAINKCIEEGCCNRNEKGYCKVRNVYLTLQEAIEERLQSIKLVDLIDDR